MRRWIRGRWLVVPPAALAFLAAAALLAMALGVPFGSPAASADEKEPATPAAEGQTGSKIDVQTLAMPLRMDTGNYYEIIEGFEGSWPGIWSVFDNNGTANGQYYWWPKTWEAHSGSYKGWPAGGGLNGYNSHTSGGLRNAYPYNLASWMVSPPIDLTNAVAGDVSFWMLLDTELNFDYCGVYASLNGTNYYGTGVSGNTGGWRYYDYDIANWPGLGNLLGYPSVRFASICTSDNSINYSAMYVDDIELQVTLACDQFSHPYATCYPSMPFDRTNWPAKWAIDEPLDPDLSCTGPYFDSIWYHFQAPCNGTARVDTYNSDYDTVLGVFSGGSPGTERACSDDAGGTTQSDVTFSITSGVTYHVLAGTFDSGVGRTLRLRGVILECRQEADVRIVSQGMLNPPSSIPVNQNVNLTLRKIIHNNGPNGPAPVNISTGGSGPGDCTITPPGSASTSLPVSVNVTVDETWTVRCSQASTHTFTLNNSIAVGAGWTDPDMRNNTLPTQFPVAVTGSADVAIASQSVVNPPSQIQCNQNVQVTLRKDIVNNGPYSPVDVNIRTLGVAPAGCTITPPASIAPQKLDVAADAAVDEVWTIHCSEQGAKTFTFNNAIDVTTAHVSDPNPGNNTRSTPLTVTVVCPADAKIVSQSVSPPSGTTIPRGQPVTVRLTKTLHDNGPYGPVAVSITASASAPSGSTATPNPNNPTSANLPVSVAQTVVEEWTVNCGVAGPNTFTFNNSIAVTTPNVTDPNTANNASQTQATYTCGEPLVATVRIGSGTCTPGQAPGQDCTVPLDVVVPAPYRLAAFTVDIVYGAGLGLSPQAWNSTGSPMDMVQCTLNYAANTVRCTGISAAGQGGNFRLANLTFRCAAGMTQCAALDVRVVTFADPNGQPILNRDEDGEICPIVTVCGDVNCSDGANPVDSVDCLFILQYVVGQKQCSSQCPPPAGTLVCDPTANTDGQNGITSIDALFCLQHVVGTRPQLTCAPLP